MFSYHEINLYLNDIELPRPLSEITEKTHDFDGHDLHFLNGVKKHLIDKMDYESHKSKVVYRIGTCRFNLTQIGLYLLLEDEVIFIYTSMLKFNEELSEWTVNFFPYKEIVSLEFNDDYKFDNYDSGILYIKLRSIKGATRSKTIRNINPNHFDCVRDFHEKMLQEKYI